jgi:hypothetical protein
MKFHKTSSKHPGDEKTLNHNVYALYEYENVFAIKNEIENRKE